MEIFLEQINYIVFLILMLIGVYAMMIKNNLMKKVIGLIIFQTSIILYFISLAYKDHASIPILAHHSGADHHIDISHYDNPVPHALMLTAIVVGVATTGLALALIQRIYERFNTLEEDQIIKILKDK